MVAKKNTNPFISDVVHLRQEWHPKKNSHLDIEKLRIGSRKEAWWICSNGHEWQSKISRRGLQGQTCFTCRSLGFLHPELSKQFSTELNLGCTPFEVSAGSNKKFWFRCSDCSQNYEQSLNAKVSNGHGCPFCSGRRAGKFNSLAARSPELMLEWHPTKNLPLTPETITYGSPKKVWWVCEKKHEFEATVGNRLGNSSGCPTCSGRFAHEERNLFTDFPKIAKEWHPELNGEKVPTEFTPFSSMKAWWLCPNGHSYEAVIGSRTARGSGCGLCSNQTSRPELRILAELRAIFLDIGSRVRVDGAEVDILLRNHGIGIEYDGSHWHLGKEQEDVKKNKALNGQGIKVIRVRCKPLKKITKEDILVGSDTLTKSDLNEVVKVLLEYCSARERVDAEVYLAKNEFVAEDTYVEYLTYFPNPLPENSLRHTHPKLCREWDFEKNHPFVPENFTRGQLQKVFWLCPNGHSYLAPIASRAGLNSGCNVCSGKAVTSENSLEAVFPDVAAQWHPTKNAPLLPSNVSQKSSKLVWWLCKNGHEWRAKVGTRTYQKSGCKACQREKNLLVKKSPEIAAEWHPTKNIGIDVNDVTYGSKKIVWWQCKDGHEWRAAIGQRVRFNSKCRECIWPNYRPVSQK